MNAGYSNLPPGGMGPLDPTDIQNPDDFRTFTLTEIQTSDVIQCLEYRIEELKEAAGVESIHTREEINGMLNHAWDLEIIRDVLDVSA